MNENEATAASSAVSLGDEDEDEVGGPHTLGDVSCLCLCLSRLSSGVSSFFTVFYLTTGHVRYVLTRRRKRNEIALGQS